MTTTFSLRELTRVSLPVSVVASFAMGSMWQGARQGPPGPVTATEFCLVKDNGEVVGSWTAVDGSSKLSLRDEAGRDRITLAAAADGAAGLVIRDQQDNLRSQWSCSADGEVAFTGYGEDNVARFGVASTDGGGAAMVFYDAKGRCRAHVGTLESGSPSLALFSPKYEPVAMLGSPPANGEAADAALVLYDPDNGRMRASMGVSANGPMISLHDEREQLRSAWAWSSGGGGLTWKDSRGAARGVFGITPGGGVGMLSFDADGDVVHRAPQGFDVSLSGAAGAAPERRGSSHRVEKQARPSPKREAVPAGRGRLPIEEEKIPSFRLPDYGQLVTTASGLQYEVLEQGAGVAPTARDKVVVHFTTWLADGTVVDSSRPRGRPATFDLRRVIPGWAEGLQRMQPGSRYLFRIPASLGYGSKGVRGRVPPDAELVCMVELVSVR